MPRPLAEALGILLLGTCALAPVGASAQISFQQLGFERCAVPDTLSAPVAFTAKITGTYDTVRLDLAAGGSLFLTDSGGGVWTTSVTAGDLLFGYSPAVANRNFVGYLRVLQGPTLLVSLNVFISVVDAGVPAIVPQTSGADVRYSCHAVNIRKADLTYPPSSAQVQAITQTFYQHFADDFDFLNVVFSLPSWQSNRFHFAVSNDVTGLGLAVFDNAWLYGSGGALKGISEFPIDTFFDLAETGNIHEIGHQWINFCTFPTVRPGPHWPAGTQARGVMGYGAGQGLAFPYDLVAIGGGQYRMVSAPRLREFTDLDLYLMGLLPAADVDSNFVFTNPAQPVCHLCSGAVTWFTIGDLIASQGPRAPDHAASPKTFRIATIVVTRDRLLDDLELALFDHFALRGESTVALPFRSGFEIGTTLPFHLATRSLGSLVTTVCPSATYAPAAEARAGLRLRPGAPNPFGRETRILYELPAAGSVTLRVHDVAGRVVRELVRGHRPAGPSRVVWDGRDARGAAAATGVYFVRLEHEGASRSHRVVLLRP